MAWRTMAVRDQRVEFVVRAHQGQQSLSQLCAEFGISRPTGHLWLKRYREQGVIGRGAQPPSPALPAPDRPVGGGAHRPVAAAAAGLGRAQITATAPWRGHRLAGHYRASRIVTARTGASRRSSVSGLAALRARGPEPTLADGFQESQGMPAAGRPAVGDGRS